MQDSTKVKIGYFIPLIAILSILFGAITMLSNINTQIIDAYENELVLVVKASDAHGSANEQIKMLLFMGLEDDPARAKMFYDQQQKIKYSSYDFMVVMDDKTKTETGKQLFNTYLLKQALFSYNIYELETNYESGKLKAFRDLATDEYFETSKEYLESLHKIVVYNQKRFTNQRDTISASVSKSIVLIVIAAIIGICFAIILFSSNSHHAVLLFILLAAILIIISLSAISSLLKIDTLFTDAIETDLAKVARANDAINGINEQVKMWLYVGLEDDPVQKKPFYNLITLRQEQTNQNIKELKSLVNTNRDLKLHQELLDMQTQFGTVCKNLEKHYSSGKWQAFRDIATDEFYEVQWEYLNTAKKIVDDNLTHLRQQCEDISEISKNTKVLIITISIIGILIAIILVAVNLHSLENSTFGSTPNTLSRPISGAFVCPYCYSTHKISECRLKCSCNNNGSFAQRCPSGIQKIYNEWIPLNYNFKCLECTKAAVDIHCPAFIDKAIPSEFISMNSLRIALLGAKAVGKSNYIGVLIEEVRNKMSMAFNCSLSLAFTRESQDAYDQYYYRPLYQDSHTVQATDAGVQIPPLIFPLSFMNAQYQITQKAALTFYDTAGENLNDTNSMHIFNGYIANAHGIILLLDPLQVPEIRDRLSAKGFTDLPEQNTETARVLDAVIKVISSVKNIQNQIDIPLALVFTKIDVLEQYDILPVDSCFRKESEHLSHGKFVMTDFENSHIQMEALIDNWVQGALMSYIRFFKNYAFFGVSALGASPIGTLLGGKVNPRRVLDPLLWLLAKEKYIGTVK